MKILLSEDVVGLGDIGEIVDVRGGYARNFLIPRGCALELNSRNASSVGHKRSQIDAKKKRTQASAEELAQKVRDADVSIELKSSTSGKVFGSVSARDIAEELKKLGVDIDRRRILLAEPIKRFGTHFIAVKLHPEVKAQLKVNIVRRSATSAEEKEEALQVTSALYDVEDQEAV